MNKKFTHTGITVSGAPHTLVGKYLISRTIAALKEAKWSNEKIQEWLDEALSFDEAHALKMVEAVVYIQK